MNNNIYLPYPVLQGKDDKIKELKQDYHARLWNFEIEIKPGYYTDGASIPRLFWSLIGSPFSGSHSRAALIHDALYSSEYYTRKHNDWLFLELLDYCGTGWIKRNLMWSAVKIGGGFVYASHTDESIAESRKFVTVKPL